MMRQKYKLKEQPQKQVLQKQSRNKVWSFFISENVISILESSGWRFK